MSDNTYQEALNKAEQELSEALADRETLNIRISKLQNTIKSLNELCGKSEEIPQIQNFKGLGLSEAILKLLKAHPAGLTPTGIRDALERRGFDISEYANILASIHP